MASLQARKEEVKASRKVLEHAWSSVPRRKLAKDTTSIVFVHGFRAGDGGGPAGKGSDEGFDCIKDYWGDAIKFLPSYGYSDLRTVKYYICMPVTLEFMQLIPIHATTMVEQYMIRM
jgi:hypothetical protein